MFDVRALCPGKTDKETAEELADHFNKISCEFEGLTSIPNGTPGDLPLLEYHEVSKRIKHYKKPKSRVESDIFPQLMTKYCDFLAMPLTNIYNAITTTSTWPSAWKVEYVTVIPKKTIPSGFTDLRNISCTPLASKVYETFVRDWAMSQVRLKRNQYGGVAGCGTQHMLIDTWQKIMQNLEDPRAATVIAAIDYAKAFNRMSFVECLRSFAKKGASTGLLRILGAFLKGRMMTVRVGESWSDPREVLGLSLIHI